MKIEIDCGHTFTDDNDQYPDYTLKLPIVVWEAIVKDAVRSLRDEISKHITSITLDDPSKFEDVKQCVRDLAPLVDELIWINEHRWLED